MAVIVLTLISDAALLATGGTTRNAACGTGMRRGVEVRGPRSNYGQFKWAAASHRQRTCQA